MKEIVFLLEEHSAEWMLKEIFHKMNNVSNVRYICFEGKQDLDKNITRKIKSYNNPNTVFIILRDKDRGDCYSIKKKLLEKIPSDKVDKSFVRIACSELESFYLGDLTAVEKGLKLSKLAQQQNKVKYRDPDKLPNAKEELQKITKGYYQPLSGSRAIAPYLSENNFSHSFCLLWRTIQSLITISKERQC